MKNKRGSVWLWIILIIILIVVGIGLYLWLSGGEAGSLIGEGSIPSPPALPN